jgi:hypothetical protein
VHATLRADDHVLLLDIPSTAELAAIARILVRGSLVALGSRDAVDRARASYFWMLRRHAFPGATLISPRFWYRLTLNRCSNP